MSSEKIVNPIKINIDFSKFKKSGKYLFILIIDHKYNVILLIIYRSSIDFVPFH